MMTQKCLRAHSKQRVRVDRDMPDGRCSMDKEDKASGYRGKKRQWSEWRDRLLWWTVGLMMDHVSSVLTRNKREGKFAVGKQLFVHHECSQCTIE